MSRVKSNDLSGRYFIADCEHRGDVDRAISYVESIGGKVISSYWDGHDCGIAYLEISLPIEVFKRVYKNTQFQMEADINDYLDLDKIDDNSVSKQEFYVILNKMKDGDVSDGFEHIMPLHIFFSPKNNSKDIDAKKIINDIIEILGDNTKVIATSSEIVDGSIFYNALLTTDIDNLTSEKMEKRIGDFSLGNSSTTYMKQHNLYGECRCLHPIADYVHSDYEILRWVVKRIKEKGKLFYTNYYFDKEVDYNDYVKDGKFQTKVNEYYYPSLLKSFKNR